MIPHTTPSKLSARYFVGTAHISHFTGLASAVRGIAGDSMGSSNAFGISKAFEVYQWILFSLLPFTHPDSFGVELDHACALSCVQGMCLSNSRYPLRPGSPPRYVHSRVHRRTAFGWSPYLGRYLHTAVCAHVQGAPARVGVAARGLYHQGYHLEVRCTDCHQHCDTTNWMR